MEVSSWLHLLLSCAKFFYCLRKSLNRRSDYQKPIVGKLLSSKFGMKKLTKGKFLKYFFGLIFRKLFRKPKLNFQKKNIFME